MQHSKKKKKLMISNNPSFRYPKKRNHIWVTIRGLLHGCGFRCHNGRRFPPKSRTLRFLSFAIVINHDIIASFDLRPRSLEISKKKGKKKRGRILVTYWGREGSEDQVRWTIRTESHCCRRKVSARSSFVAAVGRGSGHLLVRPKGIWSS